jgi:hypothetical protein
MVVPSPTTPSIANNRQATTPYPAVCGGLGDSSQYSTSPQVKPLPPSKTVMASLLPVNSPDDEAFGAGVVLPSNTSMSSLSSHTIPMIGAEDVHQTMESQWTELAYSSQLSISPPPSGSSRALVSIPPDNIAPVDVSDDAEWFYFTPSFENEDVPGGLVAAKSPLSQHVRSLESQVVVASEAPLMPRYSSSPVKGRAIQAGASSPAKQKRVSSGGTSSVRVRRGKTKMLVEQRIQKARAERDKKKQESLLAISVHDISPKDPSERVENNHDASATEPKSEEKEVEPFPTLSSASNWLALLGQEDLTLDSQVDPRRRSPQPLKKTNVDESSPKASGGLQVQGDKMVQACARESHASGCPLCCETQEKTRMRDVENQDMIVEDKMSSADTSHQPSFNVKRTLFVVCFCFLLTAGIALALLLSDQCCHWS